MKREPTVDPERIIVMGHGWGAVTALMLAKAVDVKAVVLLAPPFRDASKVLGERSAAILGNGSHGRTRGDGEGRSAASR